MAEGSSSKLAFSYDISTAPFRQRPHEARQQNTLTDFIIKVDDKQIPCHKWILSLQSEYFNRMLSHEGTKEVVEGVVTLELMDPWAVLLVVEFFYTGKIDFDFDRAYQVMEVLNYFQVTDGALMDKFYEFIINNLTCESCLLWYILCRPAQLT